MRTYYNDQPKDLDLSEMLAHRLVYMCCMLLEGGVEMPEWALRRECEAFYIHNRLA